MKTFKQQIIDREDKVFENHSNIHEHNTFIKHDKAKKSLNLMLGAEFKEVYLPEIVINDNETEFSNILANIGDRASYVLTKHDKVIMITSSVYCDVEFKEI